MTLDLNAFLAAVDASWQQDIALLEAQVAADEAEIAAQEADVLVLEAAVPEPEPDPTVFLSNPSTARTVGPQVVSDTGWQDLGDIFGTFAAESAVDGATGSLSHSGTLYLYCDKGDGNPNAGLRVDSIGGGRYKNVYYRTGGQWTIFSGAAATMDYGKALLKEDKFTVSYNDEEGIIQFFVNGIQAHRIVAADVLKALPGGPGRFGRYVKGSGTDDLKTTLSSNGGAPLRILAMEPHFSGRGTEVHIGYTNPVGSPPTGFDARLPNGSIVPCTLTENLRPGRAKITIPDASVPALYAGKTMAVTIVQRDNAGVSQPAEYIATERTTWGLNASGYPRMYNNIATAGWRGDGYGKSGYGAANPGFIDVLTGNIISFEPGVNAYLIQLDKIAVDARVRAEWTGGQSATLNDPGRGTSNVVTGQNFIEFDLKANQTATYISVNSSTWDPANPVRNIWCSEVVSRGGAYVDKTTWHADYLRDVKAFGRIRVMDLMGSNSYHTGFTDGVLTWANRRQSRAGLSPRNGRMFATTSHATNRLSLNIRGYASAEYVGSYMPNDHWYGTKSGNWSVTILAAASSGSGSIVVTGKDIVITPPPANTVQSVIDLMRSTKHTIEMLDVSYGGASSVDTMVPMSKTYFRDGVDADPAVVTAEDLGELFAKTGLEPFINTSVNVDADYAIRLVTIIRDKTGKVPRLEHGNEAFNLSFPGSLWYGAWSYYRQSTATNILERSIGESCHRAVIIFTALKNAFGAGVRTCLGSIAAGPSVTTQIVNYPGMTKDILNVVVIAPYFYPTQDQPDDDVYFNGGYASVNAQITYIDAHKKIANPKGIAIETYEVGQHSTESNLELQQRRQRSPRMKTLYGYYLGEVSRVHGFGRTVPFYHYHWISQISTSQSGAWGMLEYLGQPRADAPKYDAYLDAYEGIFPPYTRYGTNLRILGTRGPGQTLSLDLPATFNTRAIDIQWTLDGVAVSGAKGWKYIQDDSVIGKKPGVFVKLIGDNGYTTPLSYIDPQPVTG